MKRFFKLISLLVLASLLSPGLVFASQEGVKVSLLKKTSNQPSMAARALKAEAKSYKKDGKTFICLEFLPLDFMGRRGYLGKVSMLGQEGRVLSTYQDYDGYNHPTRGKDKEMKGKAYPRLVEFPLDRKQSTYTLSFYVPIMGEMGFGRQEARLQVHWPEDQDREEKKMESKEGEPSPSNQGGGIPLDLEDGLYKLDVALWHEKEDKASMGNAALEQEAELEVKDGVARLYLATKKLNISNIEASLCRIFYQVEDGFQRAEPLDYDLNVQGEDLPRPRIFALDLRGKTSWLPVKVDPKVAPMGDEPLNARLKLDFDRLEKIGQDQANLLAQAKTGKKKPSFQEAHRYFDKGVALQVPENCYEEDFDFYANQLKGQDLAKALAKLGLPQGTRAYRLESRTPIEKIPQDYQGSVEDLARVLKAKKPMEVTLPEGGRDPEIFNEKGDKIPSSLKDGRPSFKTGDLGVFFVKTKEVLGGDLLKPVQSIGTWPIKAGPGRRVKTSPAPVVPPVLASSQPESPDSIDPQGGLEEANLTGDQEVLQDNGDSRAQGNKSSLEEEMQERERPGLIVFFLTLILGALGVGLYGTKKYYDLYMEEVSYEIDQRRNE